MCMLVCACIFVYVFVRMHMYVCLCVHVFVEAQKNSFFVCAAHSVRVGLLRGAGECV